MMTYSLCTLLLIVNCFSTIPTVEAGSSCEPGNAEFDRLNKMISDYADITTKSCRTKLNGVPLINISGIQYHFSSSLGSWFEARDYCQSKGMDLASFETFEESTAVLTHVSTRLMLTTPNRDLATSFWIGLNCLTTAGRWIWPTTVAPPNYHFQFLPGENDSIGSQRCGLFYKMNSHVGYANGVCDFGNRKCRYICEVQSPCHDLLRVSS